MAHSILFFTPGRYLIEAREETHYADPTLRVVSFVANGQRIAERVLEQGAAAYLSATVLAVPRHIGLIAADDGGDVVALVALAAFPGEEGLEWHDRQPLVLGDDGGDSQRTHIEAVTIGLVQRPATDRMHPGDLEAELEDMMRTLLNTDSTPTLEAQAVANLLSGL